MIKDFFLKRQNIRQHLRNIRFNLASREKIQAANLLAQYSVNFSPIVKAEHITIFLSIDGEIDTYPLINQLWKKNKKVYLPIIHPFAKDHLLFSRYTLKTKIILNKLNFLEPILDITQIITLDLIDIMFIPLVAFDIRGYRIGMGKGFYDRTLKNWQKYNFLPIGIAYDCQLVNNIPESTWDVQLPIILTPSKIWHW
ncbi:5-formyltetrahydrofolate cyclo-ligase [Pantoea sp. Mhis]|uniref:5-formyltetrahydrofolate cyclo-ligase n=1 Tax=Pantoea sp. Mhis TaxID=2576759 RepID=UPI001356A0C3|nr:5-formyltetrahydrofolate cyclo-ligase [Pantoea sp. Mhis]MXP56680.1 5-formyltetrahydrofolate cyclo-ligase [Pantoea sp. Mhis]